MRRARSGAIVPPRPFTLWQRAHCWVSKSCSPRRASPPERSTARAQASARGSAARVRRIYIADLLFGDPNARGEDMRMEPFIEVERLPVAVVLPFGVPVYVLHHR